MYLGEIRIFAGNFAPSGWMFCDGSPIPIAENDALFMKIGTTWGGDGENTFALPDLRGCAPVHHGSGAAFGSRGNIEVTKGDGRSAPGRVALNFIVSLYGAFSGSGGSDAAYVGEVRPFAVPYTPRGWGSCDGSLMQISGNTGLFAIIGNAFGGDAKNFALPDLRGAFPYHPKEPGERGEKGGVQASPGGAEKKLLAIRYCIALTGVFPPRG